MCYAAGYYNHASTQQFLWPCVGKLAGIKMSHLVLILRNTDNKNVYGPKPDVAT